MPVPLNLFGGDFLLSAFSIVHEQISITDQHQFDVDVLLSSLHIPDLDVSTLVENTYGHRRSLQLHTNSFVLKSCVVVVMLRNCDWRDGGVWIGHHAIRQVGRESNIWDID